jgi:hypothetical protein
MFEMSKEWVFFRQLLEEWLKRLANISQSELFLHNTRTGTLLALRVHKTSAFRL